MLWGQGLRFAETEFCPHCIHSFPVPSEIIKDPRSDPDREEHLMLVRTDLGPQLQICFCSESGAKGWLWVHRVVLPSYFRREDDQVIEVWSPGSSVPKLGGRKMCLISILSFQEKLV